MFEFFIALFGGIYWLIKIGNARAQKRNDLMESRISAEYASDVASRFSAPLTLENKVKAHVNIHFKDLLDDPVLNKDLTYIYGSSYVYAARHSAVPKLKTPEQQPFLPRHFIKDCMVYLILAKDYRKLAHFYSGFAIGDIYQMPYSLRMIKCLNKYIDDEACELTLVPYTSYSQRFGATIGWKPCTLYVMPAVYNSYAKYPEAHSDAWSQYC